MSASKRGSAIEREEKSSVLKTKGLAMRTKEEEGEQESPSRGALEVCSLSMLEKEVRKQKRHSNVVLKTETVSLVLARKEKSFDVIRR